MRVEQVTDPITYHGEGPVWSPTWGGLRWVDMLAGDILTLLPNGTAVRKHVGDIAAAVRPRRQGGAVIAIERGFALEDVDGTLTKLPALWVEPRTRMNEGGCDPQGRFYCGSIAVGQPPGSANLFRLDAHGEVQVVFNNVTVSNGLGWSPDGSRVYYNDTATHRITEFDYDPTEGLTNGRPFAVIPNSGRPDGLTVDAEGGIWCAISNGGAVHRYTANGKLVAVIPVPVRKATACTFGGPMLDKLYITTSREGLAPGEDPLAGSLFSVDVGVQGMPVLDFAG
jgi:sugar lactone lactonase YvrE